MENQDKKHGGKREGSGRPTDAIKHRFQRILEESNAYERLKKILIHTKDDEVFMKALQITLDRGFGKPLQEVDLDSPNIIDMGALALIIQKVRSENVPT